MTRFFKPESVEWSTDSDCGSQQLVEFAGRACYQSWHNPAGRTNLEYIENMLDHGHLSVIEHASASFYLTGISRSLTHELIRHRHFSFSQMSQRYVPEANAQMVEPRAIADDPEAHAAFEQAVRQAQDAYSTINALLEQQYKDVPDRTLRRKLARQAARSVLPNATETRMVLTGNFRAFRHFFRMRTSEHADVEIRALALKLLRILQQEAPAIFGDYVIETLPDGTEIASTRYTYD
jgi:thymidylate synthase (FAD)